MVKFHRTDIVICSHSREGKTLSYSRINTAYQGFLEKQKWIKMLEIRWLEKETVKLVKFLTRLKFQSLLQELNLDLLKRYP